MLENQFGAQFHPVPLPDYKEYPLDEMRARAQNFHDFAVRRHTVRDFSTRPVPRDIIEQCILTAGTAPNGANHQPWHFSVIGDPGVKKRIRVAAVQTGDIAVIIELVLEGELT